MKTLTIYENGNQTTVLILDDKEARLHELAKDGKIFVVKQENIS